MKRIQSISLIFISLFYLASTIMNFAPACQTEADHQEYAKAIHNFFHHDSHEDECLHPVGIGEEELKKNSKLYELLHKIYDKEDTEDQECVTAAIQDVHHNDDDLTFVFSAPPLVTKSIQLPVVLLENELFVFYKHTKYKHEEATTLFLRGPPNLF